MTAFLSISVPACFVMVLVRDRAAWVSGGFVRFGAPFFLVRNIFTNLLRQRIYVRLIISVPACFVMVLVRDRASSTLILLFVGAFLERGIFTHLFRLFVCVRFIISMRRSLHLSDCQCDRLFRTRNIHTLHSPVYFCWPLGCLGFRYVWGAFF